jgi:hypothetical protein
MIKAKVTGGDINSVHRKKEKELFSWEPPKPARQATTSTSMPTMTKVQARMVREITAHAD